MNRIVVTGAEGFLGGQLADYFSEHGWATIGICRGKNPHEGNWHKECLEIPSQAFTSFLKNFAPSAVIHAAGGASVPASLEFPEMDFHNGPQLTIDLLGTLRSSALLTKFIFLSSAAIYGNPERLPISESLRPAPISSYGYHKWMAELAVREYAQIYGIAGASLRIFSAYGYGLRKQVVWDLCRKAIEGEQLLVRGTGNETRDFVHVEDICRAVECLLNKAPLVGECYNLGSGVETRIGQIAQWISTAAGHQKMPEFDGVFQNGMPLQWCADISKLKALGWEPTVAPKEGLLEFIDWCLAELRL